MDSATRFFKKLFNLILIYLYFFRPALGNFNDINTIGNAVIKDNEKSDKSLQTLILLPEELRQGGFKNYEDVIIDSCTNLTNPITSVGHIFYFIGKEGFRHADLHPSVYELASKTHCSKKKFERRNYIKNPCYLMEKKEEQSHRYALADLARWIYEKSVWAPYMAISSILAIFTYRSFLLPYNFSSVILERELFALIDIVNALFKVKPLCKKDYLQINLQNCQSTTILMDGFEIQKNHLMKYLLTFFNIQYYCDNKSSFKVTQKALFKVHGRENFNSRWVLSKAGQAEIMSSVKPLYELIKMIKDTDSPYKKDWLKVCHRKLANDSSAKEIGTFVKHMKDTMNQSKGGLKETVNQNPLKSSSYKTTTSFAIFSKRQQERLELLNCKLAHAAMPKKENQFFRLYFRLGDRLKNDYKKDAQKEFQLPMNWENFENAMGQLQRRIHKCKLSEDNSKIIAKIEERYSQLTRVFASVVNELRDKTEVETILGVTEEQEIQKNKSDTKIETKQKPKYKPSVNPNAFFQAHKHPDPMAYQIQQLKENVEALRLSFENNGAFACCALQAQYHLIRFLVSQINRPEEIFRTLRHIFCHLTTVYELNDGIWQTVLTAYIEIMVSIIDCDQEFSGDFLDVWVPQCEESLNEWIQWRKQPQDVIFYALDQISKARKLLQYAPVDENPYVQRQLIAVIGENLNNLKKIGQFINEEYMSLKLQKEIRHFRNHLYHAYQLDAHFLQDSLLSILPQLQNNAPMSLSYSYRR